MNKLIPLAKFTKEAKKNSFLANTSVVVDEKNVPLGFVFGREAFISFLEHIDDQFEKKVTNQKRAFNNPAGKLIDLIEEKLQVNPEFIKDLKSYAKSKKSTWIPFEKIVKSLHV